MAGKWPTTATDSDLYIAVNELQNNLSGAVNSAVTTLPLNSATGFPTVGLVLIDNEVIQYTGISTNNLTGCTRGFDGTTAAAHSSSAIVSFAVMAAHHNVLKDEMIAVETDLAGVLLSITGATPGATATSILNRMAQVTQQLKNMLGSTNWYDAFTQFKGPDGTANAPAWTFTTQTNMGLYRFGTDTVGVSAGGVNQLQVSTVGTLFNKPLTLTNSAAASEPLTITNTANTQKAFVALNSAAATAELDIAINRDAVTGTYNKTGQGSAYIGLQSQSGIGTVTIGSSSANNGSPSTVATFQDTGCSLKGSTTNDSASAGNVGEIVKSVQGTYTNVPGATSVWANIISISLTAGDYDVSANFGFFPNAATLSGDQQFAVSVNSGGTTTDHVLADNQVNIARPSNNADTTYGSVAAYRLSLASTTTVFLKTRAQYSAGTPQCTGRISARRVR